MSNKGFGLVWFDTYCPGKQFFSHVGMEPSLPGYYQYFWGVNMSCSRTQHGDPELSCFFAIHIKTAFDMAMLFQPLHDKSNNFGFESSEDMT